MTAIIDQAAKDFPALVFLKVICGLDDFIDASGFKKFSPFLIDFDRSMLRKFPTLPRSIL